MRWIQWTKRTNGWIGLAVIAGGFWVGDVALADERVPSSSESLWEAILLTEAAGEPYEGKVGVAEVLRNRGWDPAGFVGIRRRDLHRFLSNQPGWAHAQARGALRQARAGSNLTRNATHFENVEVFGPPSWAREMEQTVRIGRLTFYKKRGGSTRWMAENSSNWSRN